MSCGLRRQAPQPPAAHIIIPCAVPGPSRRSWRPAARPAAPDGRCRPWWPAAGCICRCGECSCHASHGSCTTGSLTAGERKSVGPQPAFFDFPTRACRRGGYRCDVCRPLQRFPKLHTAALTAVGVEVWFIACSNGVVSKLLSTTCSLYLRMPFPPR